MSLVPSILPDELLLGYLGRVAALNGCANRRDVALALGIERQARDAPSCEIASVLSAVSKFNGLSVDQMLASHTCHALSRSVGYRTSPVAWRNADDEANRLSTRNLGNRLRYCPDCIQRDLKRSGFSYWRRRHQIPGRYVCGEHARCLGIAQMPSLADSFPEDAGNFQCAAEPEAVERCLRNPLVAFVLNFLEATLDSALIFDRERCSSVIQRIVRERGEEPTAPGWHRDFCRQIEASFPMAWLRLIFPAAKFPGGHLRPFYMGWISQHALSIPHVSLAVVASLLFPDAGHALAVLTSDDC